MAMKESPETAPGRSREGRMEDGIICKLWPSRTGAKPEW